MKVSAILEVSDDIVQVVVNSQVVATLPRHEFASDADGRDGPTTRFGCGGGD